MSKVAMLLVLICLPVKVAISAAATTATISVSVSEKRANPPAAALLAELRAGKIPDVEFQSDLTYLEPERPEKLDLYLPVNRVPGERSPAIVIIHGGGWAGGDKAARRELVSGIAFAQAGYVAISVEYEKREGKRWPTNLQDCKNGVRWLRANAEKLQIDSKRIGVIGGSAGGHLALMVAYTSGIEELEPDAPYPGVSSAVAACVNLYGITNLATRQRTAKDGKPTGKLYTTTTLFTETRKEAPEKYKLASPVHHITKDSPPTLTIHGSADRVVDRQQATEINDALRREGVLGELISIPKGIHAFALDDRRLPEDMRPAVISFFDQHLTK